MVCAASLALAARGLEIVLRLSGASAVEQRLAALLGLEPGQCERPVEIERRFAGLVCRDPEVAGRRVHARCPRVLVR